MCFVIVTVRLGVSSVRLSHGYVIGVKLIHIKITSERLTHRYAMHVKLIHIQFTSESHTLVTYEAHSYVCVLGSITFPRDTD